jgi:hypothetical protein
MAKKLDLLGKIFERLTVLRETEKRSQSSIVWLCRCVCGKEKLVSARCLVHGLVRSCGCLSKEITVKHNKDRTRHGHSASRVVTSEYKSWVTAKQRCGNPHNHNFPGYGGRGIKVCDRWLHSFENFFADMGPKPEPKSLYSLDRVLVNGNYEPSNCRWATASEQARNRRRVLNALPNPWAWEEFAEVIG